MTYHKGKPDFSQIKYITLPAIGKQAYRAIGTGKPLILLHGLGNYGGVWELNTIELQKSYQCICPDLPGNGLSENSPGTYSIKAYAQSQWDLIDALGLEQVSLGGHSMGGQIAITMALQHPERVTELFLFAPSGFEPYLPYEIMLMKQALFWTGFMYSDRKQLQLAIQNSFYTKAFPFAEKILGEMLQLLKERELKAYQHMIRQSITAMLDEPVREQVRSLTMPCSIFFGEYDQFIPNRSFRPFENSFGFAQELQTQWPGMRMHRIPSCGHFVHAERANEVNKLILSA